ncbi:MCP four helix bundle domain-containing protein [Microcoleus sp. A003_D6]|uniref:MCP four helix bundle domain-containing protein n=1 Tax=Microcoleus sp. A003_D6 TaxID=3055266 RepID=UPI002FD3692D
MALIGLSGNYRLKKNIDAFAYDSLPRIDNLWKINKAKTKTHGSEKVLIANALTNDRRQKELTTIQNAAKDINEGFNACEKLPRQPEQDITYKKVLADWEKWKAASQEYVQIHEKYQRYGILNPRKIQTELLQQG